MADITDDEVTMDESEETTEEAESSSLEALGDDLLFLRGDNMSFYLASKAYYEDQNYEEAIEKYQAAIEYEKSQSQDSLKLADSSENSEEKAQEKEPNDVIAKSMYWLGESYVKTNQTNPALKTFEQLASDLSEHYLGIAAQRRVATLNNVTVSIASPRSTRQEVELRKEKQILLKSLREFFEQDFLNAYDFYQARCTAHISLVEYNTEKINAERREKERQERARREAEKRVLLKSLREHLERDFLTSYDFYQARCTAHISLAEYNTEKIIFVQSWAERFLNPEAPKPDDEQAAAIGAVEGNVQVVARAGSGKTATLVNRALFLQQHCRIDADELLLLAFNKKAAEEMKERIGTVPHVMTFHALAYALVQPTKMLLDEPEGGQSQSRSLQAVVDQYLCNADYADQIRDLMMGHFRDDWERHEDWQRIVSGGYGPKAAEILRSRRSLNRETLDGIFVKSFGETVISNFLFEHDISYKYEWNFRRNDGNYQPDFTVFTGGNRGIIIEYFGLAGDPDYDKMSAQKRDYWRDSPGWELIELFPCQLKHNNVDGFCNLLKENLEAHDIPCNRLSEEQIWDKIKPRSIYRFTTVVMGFIQRCRKLALTPDQLSEMIWNHQCVSEVEAQFLNLAQPLYAAYLEQLQSSEEETEDFDGLLQKATELVTTGKTDFKRKSGAGNLKRVRFVMIDEYQDFSELFYRLMEAFREQNPRARFFCVGDDWQAINGFAGSDLHFFQNFEQLFEDAHILHVATNYRSAQSIVDVGNALMQGQGPPACAHKRIIGKVEIADIDALEMTPQEEKEHSDNKLTPAVLRLVNKAINNDKDVALLSRMNRLSWRIGYEDNGKSPAKNKLEQFLELLRSHLPEDRAEKVTILTAHKSKGLQGNVVIVLDAVPQCYPLIHPDSIFTRIFGNTIERIIAEERRLFYVALTRAEENLFILTERDNVSPFLKDLEGEKMSRLEWSDYPAQLSPSSDASITIRVSNQKGGPKKGTHAIKDALRAEGYCWDSKSEVWYVIEPAAGFSLTEFRNKVKWRDAADGIEVRFYDYSDKEIGQYHVDKGQWRCVAIYSNTFL